MPNQNQSELNLPPPAENIKLTTRDEILTALARIKEAKDLIVEKHIIDPRTNDWTVDENAINGPITGFDILNLPDPDILKIGWSINNQGETNRRELSISTNHTAIVIRAGAKQDGKARGAGDIWLVNLDNNSARVFTGFFPPQS